MRFHFHGVSGQLFLVLIGLCWCLEAIRRFRSDAEELRTTNRPEVQIAIIAWWAVSTGVAAALLIFVPGIVREYIRLLH